MRYVKSTQGYGGPSVMVQADARKQVVVRRAALPVEWGVKGTELMDALKKGAEKFIRAMELQGLTLIPLAEGNPQVVTTEDGTPLPTYSMTFDLMKAQPDKLVDDAAGAAASDPTLLIPQNLEMSRGFVDYQIVGVFLAPEVSVEILKRREDIIAAEKAAKNPRTWGGGKTTPNRPSLA